MDRKRQHTDSEPGQRGARRSDDYEQRENKRGRHIEHPAASLPPSLQRRLQWLDEEPQQQERSGNQQQHDPRKQGGRGQRQDPRGGADRPYPQQQGSRDGRSYDARSPAGPQSNRPQQQQQQRQGQQPQQQHRDSYRPQQQQQQRSPRRGSDSAQREPRQREQQHAQGLDRQGSRGGVFDRLGGTSERHPGETGDQRYASRDGRGNSSRPRQGGSPGRGARVDSAGEAAAGGERRDCRGGPEYDRSRDRLSSGAHAYRDDGGGNAAAGASSRRSSSPRQGRHSDQGEQRQYSAERGGGRSSSPGAAGRARRQASESEGRRAGRSADRSTPEQRHHQAAGAGDPGSSSRHQSGSRDRSRGSSHEQQQDQHHQQPQQRAAVTPGGGAAEQPPSTSVSRKSTASKHTPIVFDLPPPPPASEGDLMPLRSSRSEDRGREPQGASGQGAKHEQQQRSSSGVRERPQQEQGRGDDSRRCQEVRRSVSPVGRGREAGRDAPPRRVPQLSPEPFKRPGAAVGDRGDSRDRRGQEVDRSRERAGRGGGVSSSEHWRPQVQPQVEGSSRDRAPRGRSDRGQDDDWSWRPEDAQQQASQPVVKQPSVVPEAPRSSHSKPQQQRVERHADRQLPARPSLGSPRAAGQTAASGSKPSGHGQQTEPPQQQHRERQDKQKDAPPLTPAGEQRALRKQREERRAAAVQQQLRVMHFSKALMEPQAWRELLQAVDVPEEAMDSTLAATQRMSVQASRLQSRAGAASLPLPDQAPLSSVLGNAGTEAHLHLLQESIDAYSHTAQQPWCKSLGVRGSLLLGQEFAGLLW